MANKQERFKKIVEWENLYEVIAIIMILNVLHLSGYLMGRAGDWVVALSLAVVLVFLCFSFVRRKVYWVKER